MLAEQSLAALVATWRVHGPAEASGAISLAFVATWEHEFTLFCAENKVVPLVAFDDVGVATWKLYLIILETVSLCAILIAFPLALVTAN